jgi:hypothetical protein
MNHYSNFLKSENSTSQSIKRVANTQKQFLKNNLVMMKRIYRNLALVLLVLLAAGCHKDLEVEYNNLPDTEIVWKTPTGAYGMVQGTFYNWYMTITSSISPRMAMWVMADQGTCSWANSGMYHLSAEPRVGFNNTTSYTYADIFATFYNDIYGNLTIANHSVAAINRGMTFEEIGQKTEKVKAMGYFIQGISLGYLGLNYDKAFIVTDQTDINSAIPVSGYKEILAQAVLSLDKCIEVCESANFTIEDNWINGSSYSSTELKQLASSFAARFVVYGARNSNENDQVDWNRVLNYANNGIQRDLAPTMDNSNWKCWYKYYTVRPGWARIDSRIINLMDNRYPWRFPDNGENPPSAQSEDNRLRTDFKFVSSNNMKPERGYYHYSNYEYVRSTYAISTHTGEVVDFSVAENELVKAEALLRTGNLAGALDIINTGSRVTRGGLNPLHANSTAEKILNAIFYERDIELIQTGFGIAFYDMRRRNMLQPGTMLHFPIPAEQLMVMELPNYTFGGVENADGINVSNGGWFPSK